MLQSENISFNDIYTIVFHKDMQLFDGPYIFQNSFAQKKP